MSKLWLLLKIQMLDAFDFNKARRSTDKSQNKKRISFAIMLMFIGTFSFGYSFMYSFMMAQALAPLGLTHLLLSIMMMLTCIIILVTTIAKTSSILFGYKDYDMIMSLPVKTSVVISSRILMLYIMNIFFTVLVMLPAGIVYAIYVQPDIRFYSIFIITLPFIPLVPILVSTAIGTGITIISTRFKHKNGIGTILGLLFFVFIMFFSFNSNKFVENFTNIAQVIVVKVNRIYPLAKIYTQAVSDYNVLSLFGFVGISAVLFLAYVYGVAIKYKKINTDIMTYKTDSNYKMRNLKQSSVFKSLYKKELGRYFSSTLYVMNTAVGVIMLFLGVFFLIFSPDAKQMLQTGEIKNMINKLSPLAISGFMAMTCTTASSISIEGKNLWILKSSPIDTKMLLSAKIAVNLVLLIPAALLSSIILSIALDINSVETILLFITPAVYAVFISVLGLLINLLFPKLNWTAEAAVIKQSLAVFVTMLIGVLSILVPVIIIFALAAFVDMSLMVVIITLFIVIITIVIYKYVNTKGVERFNKL